MPSALDSAETTRLAIDTLKTLAIDAVDRNLRRGRRERLQRGDHDGIAGACWNLAKDRRAVATKHRPARSILQNRSF